VRRLDARGRFGTRGLGARRLARLDGQRRLGARRGRRRRLGLALHRRRADLPRRRHRRGAPLGFARAPLGRALRRRIILEQQRRDLVGELRGDGVHRLERPLGGERVAAQRRRQPHPLARQRLDVPRDRELAAGARLDARALERRRHRARDLGPEVRRRIVAAHGERRDLHARPRPCRRRAQQRQRHQPRAHALIEDRARHPVKVDRHVARGL
jgi:hypothetical protein